MDEEVPSVICLDIVNAFQCTSLLTLLTYTGTPAAKAGYRGDFFCFFVGDFFKTHPEIFTKEKTGWRRKAV